ncbi:hypothetical protein BDN72DRAFT_849677 [Pluteus cervinus]|uniref:Uncharacterized protein n=1 Tax=Pluteus cervinus TaxID=181527 RepID=A0ACD3A6E3_9AGAR|nr:hypothetical protein BDN72DRAFT_849677 [Pluteus cervinus]
MSLPAIRSDPDEHDFVRIGAGSFGAIYVPSGRQGAIKVAHKVEDSEIVKQEFNALEELFALCERDSLFQFPRPIAYHNPMIPESVVSHLFFSGIQHGRRQSGFDPADYLSGLDVQSAVYIMDRLPILPNKPAHRIRQLFFPEKSDAHPKLLRLYFGKVFPPPSEKASKFFNSANFPLDVARYNTFKEGIDAPSAEEIASGMGALLSLIHWRAGYDARDIEFVLSGDGWSGLAFYAIDFNQMRKWGMTGETVQVLVDAHYLNDPYYPRARASDPLYQVFKHAYLSACSLVDAAREAADTFFDLIEREQARRDEPA